MLFSVSQIHHFANNAESCSLLRDMIRPPAEMSLSVGKGQPVIQNSHRPTASKWHRVIAYFYHFHRLHHIEWYTLVTRGPWLLNYSGIPTQVFTTWAKSHSSYSPCTVNKPDAKVI